MILKYLKIFENIVAYFSKHLKMSRDFLKYLKISEDVFKIFENI